MATRDYWVVFGSGLPSGKSGLAPTFITFINGSGSGIVSPAITEPGSKGLFKFAYDATQTIAFVMDGATTGLATSDRYVSGVLDPQDTFGVTLTALSATGSSLIALGNSSIALGMSNVALGTSNIALGVSNIALNQTLVSIGLSGALFSFIGSTASSFGSTSADPVDLFGFLKRVQEINEGNETYTKATGILDFYSRGSSTLLREKTISDSGTSTTKT